MASHDPTGSIQSPAPLWATAVSWLRTTLSSIPMRWKITLAGSAVCALVLVALPAQFPASSVNQSRSSAPRLVLGAPIRIQEPNGILIIKPRVAYDPLGGFFVADAREGQVRRYHSDGSLDHVIGRKGNGPGEFLHPVGVLRLPNREIVGVDMRGRITRFDQDGRVVLATQQSPVVPIYDVTYLNDSTLVLAGRIEGSSDSPLVHLWDLRRREIIRSFGAVPEHPPELESAYAFTGSAEVAVRNGEVALTFALSDSIWIFNPANNKLDAGGNRAASRVIPIPWQHYRPLRTSLPESEDPKVTKRWLSEFSAVASLFWTQDGSFVVQYVDVDDSGSKWSLVGVSPGGQRMFELSDKPRLLTISPQSNEMLFVDPSSELQNVWVTGYVRD